MRKRLFIFAAATCFALSTFATPAFAEDTNLENGQTISSEASVQSNGNSNGNSDFATPAFAKEPSLPDGQTINSEASVQSNGNSNGNSNENAKEDAPPSGNEDGLPNEENYSDEEQTNPSVADPVVAKIGGVGYSTLQEAIDKAVSGDVITLQSDLEMEAGLQFIGSGDTANDWKNITLDADNKHSLTLNNLGIYATHCKVTIKNCPALTVHAGKNPGNAHGESANISAVLFCPGTLTLDNCKTVNITNVEPITQGGSGLCIYNGGDLCIQNHTNFTVSGFMNGTPVEPGKEGRGGCSGIYIDSDTNVNEEYTKITGQILVSDNSTLTATKCYHNGITANPVNVNVTINSKINVCQNGDARNPYAHKGGIGCYYGTMTISDTSRVISENNGSTFGIFVHNLKVDGTSEIKSQYDTIYGIAFNGDAVLQSGAQSGAKMTSVGHCGPGIALYDGTASLTVHEKAILSSSNTAVGLANGGSNFNVLSGAYVYLNDNFVGLDNYPNATTTVEADAHLEICRNGARGIKNGNSDKGPGTLVLNAGLITENNKADSIPYKGNLSFDVGDFYDHENYGGGIYNEYGNVNLSPLVKVYNNKAVKAGDDLYNVDKEGNSFTINQLEPGAKGEILSDDQQIIDDWYTDYEGTDRRWSPDNAINNTDIILPRGAALKAAHGKVAPLPKPEEPTAAPTTAPANNTATATPAPTAQPAATATPTPTPAAAPSAIPQTGDTLPLVPLGLAALGSITALCVLQKRRKSKS